MKKDTSDKGFKQKTPCWAKKRRSLIAGLLCIALATGIWWKAHSLSSLIYIFSADQLPPIGAEIDSLHGVTVYFNGPVGHVSGRNLAADGYNIGQKYQCVEFIKRYYLERYAHKMPDSYGHARDFFDDSLEDGAWNVKRGLVQYVNNSKSMPQVGDLVVYGGGRYGHVAIISEVSEDTVEIIQQNPGPNSPSRARYPLLKTLLPDKESSLWKMDNTRILGWLRKHDGTPEQAVKTDRAGAALP